MTRRKKSVLQAVMVAVFQLALLVIGLDMVRSFVTAPAPPVPLPSDLPVHTSTDVAWGG